MRQNSLLRIGGVVVDGHLTVHRIRSHEFIGLSPARAASDRTRTQASAEERLTGYPVRVLHSRIVGYALHAVIVVTAVTCPGMPGQARLASAFLLLRKL